MTDAAELEAIEGMPDGPAVATVAVVEPDAYGLTGEVLESTTKSSSSNLKKLFTAGLEAHDPVTKDPRDHVRTGRRQGKEWESEIIFRDDHDVTRPEAPAPPRGPGIYPFFVVRDLELAMERVRELGGKTLDRAALGPNEVCGCQDDQGTRFGLWLVSA